MNDAMIQKQMDQIRSLRHDDPNEAIRLGERMMQVLETQQVTDVRLPTLCFFVATAFYYKGAYRTATEFCKQCFTALGQWEEDLHAELLADNHTLMASISNARGVYDAAISMLEKASELYKKAGCKDKLAYVLQRLAFTQYDLRDFEASRKNLHLCLEICGEKSEFQRLRTQILITLGITCRELNDPEQSLVFLTLALQASVRKEDPLGLANAKCELGKLHWLNREDERAITLYREAESAFRELGLIAYVPPAMLYQGEIYACRNSSFYDKTQAEICFLEALKMAQESDQKEWILSAHKSLASLYEQLEDHTAALVHYKLYLRLQCEQQDEAAKMRMEQFQVMLEVESEREKRDLERSKNASLTRANESLQKLLNERKEFMALAAHELKNPLSSILGLVDYLRGHECCESHSDIPALLELLESSSTNALSIVTSLLEDNRLEEGRVMLDVKEVDISAICDEICKSYHPRAKAKQIELHCACQEQPWRAHVDAFSIRQILDNLVSNAIKFASGGCHVWISKHSADEDAYLDLRVSDDGPGINAEDRAKLFTRFAKLSNKPTANESSSGLGLSIVKKLVEMNRGTITCQSEEGQGTTFILRLPKHPQETQSQ